jgi:DNA-directed RNA polymerase specialized sigma24 family protein
MSDVNLQLQRLIQRLQQQLQGNEREQGLDELTEQIRQSGQLAYPQPGTLAPNLYQDFCQQALQATLTEIRQKIESRHAHDSVMSWVNRILERKFKEIVSAHQIDLQLQQFAQNAQQHPPKTLERQRVLNELVNLIRQSKRIGHPQRSLWASGVYEDLHSEAFQETLIVVCQRIDTYNSDYPVMEWVNIILKRQFSDVVKKYRRAGRTNLSREEEIIPIYSLDNFIHSLEDLETLPLDKIQAKAPLTLDNMGAKDPSAEACSDGQLVRDFLRTDPENMLRTSHVTGRPDITFQKIVWAKFVDDKIWDDMAQEWDISISTLSSFYKRTLHKLKPYFQKYLGS